MIKYLILLSLPLQAQDLNKTTFKALSKTNEYKQTTTNLKPFTKNLEYPLILSKALIDKQIQYKQDNIAFNQGLNKSSINITFNLD